MKILLIFYTLLCIQDTRAQIKHEDIKFTGCSESDMEFVLGHDDEVVFHSDFKKQVLTNDLPDFASSIDFPGGYDLSISDQEICKQNRKVAVTSYKNPPEALDIPQNSIYARDDVQLGSESSLICHSARFFPPPVNISWTRNGVDVTDESMISQFYPNDDNTYNQFSHLPFTPQEGDIYTCTVQHKALESPDTKTWEVNVEVPSVGPSVFCGIGMVIGLLGVTTGMFFLVKGNQCNQ